MNRSPELRWQQRFEYTLELAWKTVKDYYLEQSGVVLSAVTPRQVIKDVACLGNPDPVDMKVYCPTGKETFDDEKTEEAPSRGDRCEAA